MDQWRKRWGKAREGEGYHPLVFHMLDVAAILDVGLRGRWQLLDFIARGLSMDPGDARKMLLTVLALHDLGKAAISFQSLNADVAERLGLKPIPKEFYRYGHDVMGQSLLEELILEQDQDQDLGLPVGRQNWDRISLLFAVATGHHGYPPVQYPCYDQLQECCTQRDLNIVAELVRIMADRFGWRRGLPDPDGLKRLSPLLNGVFALCDWLGSSDAFVYCEDEMALDRYYETKALTSARAVLDEVRPALFRRLRPMPPARFTDLFSHLGRGGGPPHPTPLQALVDRMIVQDALPEGPLLFVIEDLPGSGKTEAGDLIVQRLIACGRADGAYFGLPTMVTADAAFDRKFDPVTGFVLGNQLFEGTPQVVLAHSRRHRHTSFAFAPTQAGVEAGDGYAGDWFSRSSRRALLTELGVGTVDQALAGALRARHATLRLAGLWRKVLLIDEVHAYDDYMQAILRSLLRWQGMMGNPVILMSATLPGAIRQSLIRAYAHGAGWPDKTTADGGEAVTPQNAAPYPALTLVSQRSAEIHPVAPVEGPGTRPIRFEAVHDEDAVDAKILQWLSDGRSVIWFRNTVDDAVEAWGRHRDSADRHGFPEPLLFHARFLPGDRARIEDAVLKAIGKAAAPEARRSRLVIATQAGEQSLDLDADEIIIDLAPADAMIQRLGRRRRHARNRHGLLVEDGVDRRPDSPVLLHMPNPEASGHNWYARRFPRASRIYDDDARLWLSARLLLQPDLIPGRTLSGPDLILAKDIRPVIEAVYADPPLQMVPEILLKRHDAALGDDHAERQQGARASLPFRSGLLADWASSAVVADDEGGEPRTRLIDGYTVVFAVVEDGAPRFLGVGNPPFETDRHDGVAPGDPIEASECRSPLFLGPMTTRKNWLEMLKKSLPERRASILDRRSVIFLTMRDGDAWVGEAQAPKGRSDGERVLTVRYCPRRGLSLSGEQR